MSVVIGIDPGANIGLAFYIEGKLYQMFTTEILGALKILDMERPVLVALEDSTLTSHIFTAPRVSHAAALKVARNIGEVDACCKLIKQTCLSLNIPYLSISPKQKGKKMARKEFDALTGYKGTSNQHERDAAMVAWTMRNTKLSTLEMQFVRKA